MVNELSLYKSIDINEYHYNIAKKLDDKKNPVKLDSMTNNTYLIKVNGKLRVVRIPGNGTDGFINRSIEAKVYNKLINKYNYLPRILYYSNGILITEYLQGYSQYKYSSKNQKLVAQALSELHKIDPVNVPKRNLLEELFNYRKIYSSNSSIIRYDYDHLDNNIEAFIDRNQHQNLSITHGDLMYTNILISDDSCKLIDYEYSGSLNYYWDIGCFISECCLWSKDHDPSHTLEFINDYESYSKKRINLIYAMIWRCVVDYIWAEWSLAKTALGSQSDYKYGQQRANSFINTFRKVNEFYESL